MKENNKQEQDLEMETVFAPLVKSLKENPLINTASLNDEVVYNFYSDDAKKMLSEEMGKYLSNAVGRDIVVCIEKPVKGQPNQTFHLSYRSENNKSGRGITLKDYFESLCKK